LLALTRRFPQRERLGLLLILSPHRERQADESEWRDVWKQFFRATRVGSPIHGASQLGSGPCPGRRIRLLISTPGGLLAPAPILLPGWSLP